MIEVVVRNQNMRQLEPSLRQIFLDRRAFARVDDEGFFLRVLEHPREVVG